MRLLALDTATEACSVALLTEQGMLSASVEIGRGHAQEILRMVDRILTEGGATLASLSGIAAGIGPGSFTGVRVSVAVAQGLAYGADLRVVPVTSLEALAMHSIGRGAERVLACLDARMGEVYWGCFVADPAGLLRPLSPPAVGPPGAVRMPGAALSASAVQQAAAAPAGAVQPAAAAGRFRGIGRGFSAYAELSDLESLCIDAQERRALPQARDMLGLAAHRLASGGAIDPQLLEPLYVRDKVAMTEAERGVDTSLRK